MVGTNGVVGYSGPFIYYANALSFGTPINAGSAFQTASQVCLGSNYGGTLYGGFATTVPPRTNAYAGFRFTAADGVHFGWVFLNVNAGIIDFTSAAYEIRLALQLLRAQFRSREQRHCSLSELLVFWVHRQTPTFLAGCLY